MDNSCFFLFIKTAHPDYYKYNPTNEVRDSSAESAVERQRRSVSNATAANSSSLNNPPHSGNSTGECSRLQLFVDFEQIGWSSWIISPKGYSAYYCKGHCNFPLGQSQRPTNHATVQSIVHELNLAPDVGKPCCVPTSLLNVPLLFYDDNDNVVLRMYEDMVADSCGCL
jgi:bone morphogenetic protein 2/4